MSTGGVLRQATLPELGKCILARRPNPARVRVELSIIGTALVSLGHALARGSRLLAGPRMHQRHNATLPPERAAGRNRMDGRSDKHRASAGEIAGSAGAPSDSLGQMPVWDLRDLYPAPESEAVQADLKTAAAEARRIKERYEGRLAAVAEDGAQFAEAISTYEDVSEILGRLGAYAGLLYAGDTANPEHAKLYGDIQEQLTA